MIMIPMTTTAEATLFNPGWDALITDQIQSSVNYIASLWFTCTLLYYCFIVERIILRDGLLNHHVSYVDVYSNYCRVEIRLSTYLSSLT